MNNLDFSSILDLKKILADNKINKVLVICGKISFEKSGANTILKDLLKTKQTNFFQRS